MANLPRVAAIIATHNYGKWIHNALSSVAAQTYNLERLICGICDDGSNDDTFDLVKEKTEIISEKDDMFVGHYSERRLLIYFWRHEKAKGPSAARNTILKEFLAADLADIFGVLDADDIWKTKKVEKCVERFLVNPFLGSVYTDYDTLDENGNFVRVCNDSYSYELLLQRCCVHSGIFFKKETVQKIGLYDESLRTCEDYDFHLRTAEKFIIGHVPEALSIVRVHSQNSTNSVGQKTWQDNYAKVFEKLRARQCL